MDNDLCHFCDLRPTTEGILCDPCRVLVAGDVVEELSAVVPDAREAA